MNALAWLMAESGIEIEDDDVRELREMMGGLVPDERLPERIREVG